MARFAVLGEPVRVPQPESRLLTLVRAFIRSALHAKQEVYTFLLSATGLQLKGQAMNALLAISALQTVPMLEPRWIR